MLLCLKSQVVSERGRQVERDGGPRRVHTPHHTVDREERLPRGRFLVPRLRALCQRALYVQRNARRDAKQNQNIRATEIWAELLRSHSERPFSQENWAEGEARRNAVPARWQEMGRGVVNFVHRRVQKERAEDPLAKYLSTTSTSYFKRVGGRLLYVAVNHVPVVPLILPVQESIKALWRGMCPCGQHVISYGLCVYYWRRCGRTFVSCLAELMLYARTNNAHEELLFHVLDMAREYRFKNNRGAKLLRQTARKTISDFLPTGRLVKYGAGLIAESVYVLTGHSVGVHSAATAWDNLGLNPAVWSDIDEVVWFLATVSTLCEVPAVVYSEIPHVFGDAFTCADMEHFIVDFEDTAGLAGHTVSFSSWLISYWSRRAKNPHDW